MDIINNIYDNIFDKNYKIINKNILKFVQLKLRNIKKKVFIDIDNNDKNYDNIHSHLVCKDNNYYYKIYFSPEHNNLKYIIHLNILGFFKDIAIINYIYNDEKNIIGYYSPIYKTFNQYDNIELNINDFKQNTNKNIIINFYKIIFKNMLNNKIIFIDILINNIGLYNNKLYIFDLDECISYNYYYNGIKSSFENNYEIECDYIWNIIKGNNNIKLYFKLLLNYDLPFIIIKQQLPIFLLENINLNKLKNTIYNRINIIKIIEYLEFNNNN